MANLFEDELKSRRGKEEKLVLKDLMSAYHVSQRLPQAIVKVSSWGKSRGRIAAHLDYISRHGDYPLENPEGDFVQSKEEQAELLDDWFQDVSKRKGARHSAQIVLSAPKGADPDAARDAVRETARSYFGGKYEYVFAFHHKSVGHRADAATEHPHGHLVVKAMGKDSQQLRLGKKELHELRQVFAKELRARGIQVDASYRNERGKGTKGQKQAVVNMRKRGADLKVDKTLIDSVMTEIKEELAIQKKVDLKPKHEWEKKQHSAAQKRRNEYRKLSTELERSNDPKVKNMAKSIGEYADSMPDPKTVRQQLKEHLAEQVSNRQQQTEKGRGLDR